MQYMHFRDNSSLSIGIIRVYRDISSTISSHWNYCHVTPNFPFSRTRTYTNVQKVEVYEYKLVLNCGQFYTLFSLWHNRKKLLMLDENYWLGINPQIPSLDPPLLQHRDGGVHRKRKNHKPSPFRIRYLSRLQRDRKQPRCRGRVCNIRQPWPT